MGDDMASFPDAAAGECSPPIDAGKAEAALRITLPRLEERRGRKIRLPIRTA